MIGTARQWTLRANRAYRMETNVIETEYLRLPAGDPVILRDFLARAEADLANPSGLTQTWPAFAADVRRAVERARAALGEFLCAAR
jgi:hypothetical protein